MANFSANIITPSAVTAGMSTMSRINNSIDPIPQITYGPAGTTATTLFRGRLAGNYIYSIGTVPGGGATDIVIITIY